MTTVGSLAYSIVANSQQFTAGVAASKAELRTLKEAFIASTTPAEKFGAKIDELTHLAEKFPQKAEVISRAMVNMRSQMAGGFHEGAKGGNELSESLDRINSRMGRMMISDVMATLNQIPGAGIAIDIAFGNWIGAVVHAFELAHRLAEETKEAVNKTAESYAAATEKAIQFYEAEAKAKEKGRMPDRMTDSHLDAPTEKAVQELGMGKLGYSASGTMAGMGERMGNWLIEHSGIARDVFGVQEGGTKEKAIELGKKQIRDEIESRRLNAEYAPNPEANHHAAEEIGRGMDAVNVEIANRAEELHAANERAAEAIGKGMDAVNIEISDKAEQLKEQSMKAAESIGRGMDDVNKEIASRAEHLADSLKMPVERLQDNLAEIMDLSRLGALSDETRARALEDIHDKAETMADKGSNFSGITKATFSASPEGIAARFGQRDNKTADKQLKEQQKASSLLAKIEDAIKNQASMGIVD